MVRRLKGDLVDKDGKPIYPPRKLQALEVPFTADERAVYRVLDTYCKSREQTSRNAGATATKFVNGLLKKRFFSSPAAFASTLEKHYQTLTSGKAKRDPDTIADRILRKALLKAEEDYADDSQVEAAQVEAVEEASRYSAPLTDNEKSMLGGMRAWAQAAAHKTDSKARAIVDWIESNLKSEKNWNDRRVILFTEYRTTHQWLHDILSSHHYGGDRLAIIHGGNPGHGIRGEDRAR
jgi:hypothetical protein